jgi:ABC-type Na+ efflux pump permease subunit
MRKIVLLALNDLRRTVKDRTSAIWMLLLPITLMWFFGNIGAGSSGPPMVTLTVVDRDGGWLAREFVEELKGEQINLQQKTPQEAATAENKVRTLVIPGGFTANVLAGEAQTLRLEKEQGSDEDFGLAAQVNVVRAAVRTIARLVEMDQAGELAGEGSEAGAAERFRALGDREPLVRLEVTTAGEGRPVPRGRAQSVPGTLTMTVLMMTLIYGAVFLTTEKQDGTLRRQMTLPVGRGHVYAGKLLGRFLIAAVQVVVLLAAGKFLYQISYGPSVAGLALLTCCFCLAVAGLTTLMGAVLRTPEQAGSIGWLLTMVLAALGGCWWPAEVMPRWLRQASHALPTAWAMDGFHALISFGRGLDGVIVPSLALLGFAVVFSALGARLLRA